MKHEPQDGDAARLAAIVASSSDAIYSRDLDGKIATWNAAAERLYGYPAAEVIGRSIDILIPEEGRDEEKEAIVRVLSGEPLVQVDTTRLARGGDRMNVLVTLSPIHDRDGVITGISKIARDVQPLKVANARLQQLARMLNHAFDPVIAWEFGGTITFWNRGAEGLYGYTAAEAVGRVSHDLLQTTFPGDSAGLLEDALTRTKRWEGELRHRTKAGQWVTVDSRMTLVNEGFPDVVVLEANRDVTEMKRVITELRAAKDVAEAASVAKDRFLAALSHELRTPLTPILATLSYVERMVDLPVLLREEIATIRRNVETEARLIDDLLDVTRISRGKLELRRETVDVHAVVRAALAVCQSEAEAKGIAVTTMLRAKRFHASADPARLQQIFWNLIKNAVNFTPVDGTITLKSSNAPDGSLTVVVSDTGSGIDEETMPWVFRAFEQPDKRPMGGLGLGLTIARTLIDYHRGTITAASPGPDQGASFTVTLATISPPVAHPHGPVVIADGWPAPRILFVEDNPDTLRAFDRVLTAAGFSITPATSVREALHAAASTRFDLLVCDIGLPDGDGKDVMREVRMRYGLRGIAFSGYGTDDDVRASQAAGFSHHQAKPVRAEVMVDLVRQALCNPAS